jgi:diguanylate cyclase (GGDEF)-like protein/PAS domain S-box-containing protein
VASVERPLDRLKGNVSIEAKVAAESGRLVYTAPMRDATEAERGLLAEGAAGSERGIDTTRVAMLYRMGRAGYLVSPAYAGIVLIILWRATWADTLVAWFGTLLAVTVACVLAHAAYLRTPGADPRVWERRFALGAFASGTVWAAAPLLFFAPEDALLLVAVVFLVGGSVIAAAGLYAASVLSMLAYVAPPLLAMTAQLVLQPDPAYRYLALAVALFGVVIVRIHRELHRSLIDTLKARRENEDLRAQAQASEAQMRDAIESFPEGIAIFDDAGALVSCNDAYAQRYGGGRPREALVGASYPDLCAAALGMEDLEADFAGRREDCIAARRQDLERGGGSRQFRARDGRWLQSRIVRTTFGGFVSTLTDITELKSAQDAYVALLAQEDLVLNTLPLGVAFVENDRIRRCNARLAQMLGYAAGELQGRETRVWSPSQDDWQTQWRSFETATADGRGGEMELELLRRDGSRMWCHVVGRPLNAASAQTGVILAFTDIDERRSAEHALRSSEAMYRDLVEGSNDLIWSVDRDGRWTFLNAAAVRRIYGCEPADLLGRPMAEILTPQVRARDLAVLRRVLDGDPVFNFETRHQRRDGSSVDLALNAVPVRDASGAVSGAAGTAHDISAQKRAAAALYDTVEKLRLAVEVAGLFYWEWDTESDRLRFGHNTGVISGGEGETTLKWSEYANWVHPDDRERFRSASLASGERGEAFVCEYRVTGPGGGMHWIAARGQPVFDASGRVHRIIGVSQDVTERKRSEEEARFLAHHDTLTGLPNRRLLDDRLRQAVYLAQRRDSKVAVMLLDLDGFKEVNDSLGHRAGDAVLREVAQRLSGCMRKSDTLARHGGDEFVIVIPDLTLEADCQIIAEKILRELEPEFRVDGRGFRIGASIGVSLYPADAGDGEALLRNADVAMYRAKSLGGNNYRFYAR